MNVLTVLGTRPEAVKLAPVVWELMARPGIESRLLVTAQHRGMLDQMLENLRIRPDIDLDLMKPGQDLSSLAARILTGVAPLLGSQKPDWVIVQGDTTTAFACALAAFHAKVPVAHVEAGLRTGDLSAPWPEEGNRRLLSQIASLHFAPTKAARENLLAEGHDPSSILVTGNTVIDALLETQGRMKTDAILRGAALKDLPAVDPGRRLILVTMHRRESFDGGLAAACEALAELARRPDVEILLPVHPNPHVESLVRARLSGQANIHLTAPLGYPSFVAAMARCHFILCDSGGIQEEAPSLGKPVLVMRSVTERPEAVQAGTARLVGTDVQRILSEATRLLDDPQAYALMQAVANPFGDGLAARRIVDALVERSLPKPA